MWHIYAMKQDYIDFSATEMNAVDTRLQRLAKPTPSLLKHFKCVILILYTVATPYDHEICFYTVYFISQVLGISSKHFVFIHP